MPRSGDGAKMLNRFGKGERLKKRVKVLGAYVTVTEHDYYIIVEANDYSAVVILSPIVPSQTGNLPFLLWTVVKNSNNQRG